MLRTRSRALQGMLSSGKGEEPNSSASKSAARAGGAAGPPLPPIQPSELLLEVAISTGQMLLLFPVFSIAIGLLYLLLDAILEALVTEKHDFLNAPIYYSTLYLPFSTAYFILKRRLRGRAIAGLRLPT